MRRVRSAPQGWHLAGGSVRALGGASYRPERVSQDDYWHHIAADLNEGASTLTTGTGPPILLLPDSSGHIPQTVTLVTVGPQGTGERWDVSLIQVQTSSQAGLPPLVIQQVAAQAAGKTITPPPPIAVRVWRGVAGQPVHLLGSTNQGGYDTLGISCPPLAAGEQLLAVFYGAAIGDTCQVIAKGVKYVLSAG